MNDYLRSNSDGNLIELFKIVTDEEHHYNGAHQRNIEFYSNLSLALLGVLIAGMIAASEAIHYGIIVLGFVIAIFIFFIAKKVIYRSYQRFLETITMRIKIEEDLGLRKSRSKSTSNNTECEWWQYEPIVAERHTRNMKEYSSSRDYVKGQSGKGVQQLNIQLFNFLIIACTILAIYCLCKFIHGYVPVFH